MCLLDWSHQLNTIIEMIFRTGRVSMEESLFFNYGEPSPPPHHPMDFEAMPWGFIGVSWCDGSFLWHFLFHGPQVGLHTTNPCNSHWGATPGAWSAVAFCWRRKFARMYIPSKSLALKWTGSWGLGWRAFKWVHWTSHCSPLLLHVDGRNPTVKPINTRRGILLFLPGAVTFKNSIDSRKGRVESLTGKVCDDLLGLLPGSKLSLTI